MFEQDEHWFEEFFDAIYQFSAILDAGGKIIQANRAILELTGLKQADFTGRLLWETPWRVLTGQNRLVLKRAVKQAAQGVFARDELEIHRRGLPELIVDFSLKPILDQSGAIKFIIAEGRDITIYRRATQALFQSEARFKTIFEQAGIGIVIKGLDGRMLDCNPAFSSMLGYMPEEILQLDYLEVTHALDKNISRKLFNELVNGKRQSYILEKRYLHKGGQTIWGRITASLVQGLEEENRFVIGMVENITARKQMEEEVFELQRRLMQSRELERLRVAQDLHDGPLQEIIGATYLVKELEGAITEDADREQLQTILNSLHQLTKSIRSICGELRPPTLAPFGLEKTILSHAEAFQVAHPELKIELKLAHDAQSLSEPIRIVLFRIYQEALNNILRHAQANEISVCFHFDEELAVLEVQDNGIGFELPKSWIRLARLGHLGLVGAMERARDVGGNLDITTAPRQGTLIRATVPLKGDIALVLAAGEEVRS